MEIKFKRDTSFRKQFFVSDSFAHPAKMDAQLLIWIVERYTKEGEVILDPMAGSGTMMLACGLGRNVVLVELEEKFCKMMRDNWGEVRMRPQLGYQMGNCQIIQGDARQLEGLFDKCIFSPPYAEVETHREGKSQDGYEFGTKGKNLPENPDNISNLPYGSIDKIVTSPPFNEGGNKPPSGGVADIFRKTGKWGSGIKYSEDKDNLGNLPYGNIDAVVTSPPYENAAHVDKRTNRDRMFDILEKTQGRRFIATRRGFTEGQFEKVENIGNLKSASYLEAMLQVYAQCHKVLKPCVKRCGCGIIETEVKDGQALSSGILRRGGLRDVVSPRSKVDSGSEGSGNTRGNSRLLEVSGMQKHPPIPSDIPIQDSEGSECGRIQIAGSQLSGHKDNPERPDTILDSEKERCNQDITGNRKETSAYGEAERGRCDDAEKSGAVVNQDREVLPLLKQENSANSSQARDTETCPKCHQKIRYEGGLLILVTKNFIRNKQVIRLDTDTRKLCEQAGFSYLERHYRKLPSQSFWRVIALLKCDHRKRSRQNPTCELGLECPIKEKEVATYLLGLEPEARQEAVEVVEKLCPQFINSSPKLEYEDVLVFQKVMELKV